MTTIQFSSENYFQYLNEIEKMVNTEYRFIIEDLKKFDIKNHFICLNLDTISEYEARGFVWSLFMNEVKNQVV